MKIVLRHNGKIVADGKIVGSYVRLVWGDYEIRLDCRPGVVLGQRYKADIPGAVIDNLKEFA